MSAPVRLPSEIDPEAPHVEFRANECLNCQAMGPITQVNNPEWMRWAEQHRDSTGHENFYQWKLIRNIGRITAIGNLGSRHRRQLGNRGA